MCGIKDSMMCSQSESFCGTSQYFIFTVWMDASSTTGWCSTESSLLRLDLSRTQQEWVRQSMVGMPSSAQSLDLAVYQGTACPSFSGLTLGLSPPLFLTRTYSDSVPLQNGHPPPPEDAYKDTGLLSQMLSWANGFPLQSTTQGRFVVLTVNKMEF